MSASNQKKIRKEKAMVYMSERQAAEAKEARRLKTYTLTFWIVLALCVSIVLGTIAINPIKNVIYKNAEALTIGDHTLTAVELNYFYIDAVNDYCQTYSSYLQYILDTKKPLSAQIANKETGLSWADNFLDMAKENIKSVYELYDLAVENGHQLTEDEQKSIDSSIATLGVYAMYYGYKDADAYLRNVYGNGAEVESYRAYLEVCKMADSYYTAYSDSLEYNADALRAYEKDKTFEYDSYTYATYYLAATRFRKGGTKDDKGNITYTDAEKQQAIEDAKQAADLLAAGEYADLEAFDKAIQGLEINKDVKDVSSTKNEDLLYSKVNSLFQEWLKDENRVEGELHVIASESGSGDSKVVNGYYVIRFGSIADNTFSLKNVRHLLVAFEGGKYNSSTGKTEYTKEEKEKAKLEAEKLLAEFKKGEMTEDAFADMATEHTDDTGSKKTGGLYEDIFPGQMVEAFEDWCYDAERKTGDVGLVETEYGYHIMFFVSDSETNYRDYMVTNAIRADDLKKWHDGLIENAVLTELTTKYVNKDLILGA